MEKLDKPKRQEVLKQMPLRRSLEALTFALCSLSAIGCSNISLKFKDPSVTYPPSAGSLGASGDKKYRAGDYLGAINDYDHLLECYSEIPRGRQGKAQKKDNWVDSKKH